MSAPAVDGYELSTARSSGATAEQLTELINAAMGRSEGPGSACHILASTRTTLAEVTQMMGSPTTEFLVALPRAVSAPPTPAAGAGRGGARVLAAVVRLDLPAAGAGAGSAAEAAAATEAAFGMVGTAAGHTRRGLAAALIAKAEQLSRAAGAQTLVMHFPTVREDMLRYYTKLGFEHWRDTEMPESFEHLVAPHAWPLKLRWCRKQLAPA